MIKPPKEMEIDDFKYFIVVSDLMLAGVYNEDKENIYCVILQGNMAPTGTVTSNTKKNIASQVESGDAVIVKTSIEALELFSENQE